LHGNKRVRLGTKGKLESLQEKTMAAPKENTLNHRRPKPWVGLELGHSNKSLRVSSLGLKLASR